MKRQDYRFFHRLRVRWAEVDMQKIVFNAHYLMYFDVAIADYWRTLGLPYESAMQQLGGDIYLRKATVDYRASAHADDQIDVALCCERIGTTSLTFRGAIFRGEQGLVGGELVYVFADPATQTARPVPAALRDLLTDYEAGHVVVSLHRGDWSTLGPDAMKVRSDVFLKEQSIPEAMEWDDADAVALHAVARNRLGQALATGRLLAHAPGVGRIGRMAVIQALRGAHLGRDVLQILLAAAWARADEEVVLYAQRSAVGFYQRLGFVCRGAEFDEVGIPHVEMFIRRPPEH